MKDRIKIPIPIKYFDFKICFLSRISVTSSFSLGIVALLLAGCASHTWTTGENMPFSTLEAIKGKCSYIARNGRQSSSAVSASGPLIFVAGALVIHTIGSGVRAIGDGIGAQSDFNDCMIANGAVIADNAVEKMQPAPYASPKSERVDAAQDTKTNTKIDNISRGMTEDQVRTTLGEPESVDNYTGNSKMLRYTLDTLRCRIVITDGVVTMEKICK